MRASRSLSLLRLVLNGLEPLLHTRPGDRAFVIGGVRQQAVLAGMLLNELLQFAGSGVEGDGR